MFKLNKNVLLGTIITLSGSFAYVLMGVISKLVSKHLLLNQIIFLQSISGLLFACYFVKLKKYKWQQVWKHPRLLSLTRIGMSLASIYALIYGLQYVSVFNALVILNLAPFIIPLFRRIFFKKKINVLIIPSILLAFAGLILILSPDRHIIEVPIVIILISMLCMAVSLLILEKVEDSDPNLSIFYYFLYSSLVISVIVLLKQEIQISLAYVPLGIVIGVLFFFVQLSVLYAVQYISSQLISILFYFEIIMALVASIIFENIQLNSYLILGIGLIIIGGMGMIMVENKSL